ncbi:MAG TPA: glycosyltransferase family 4 protein [Anaerolineae bacterium]|nr:glycosyltransferase family 4 protein [Anaerolineae bacterium]
MTPARIAFVDHAPFVGGAETVLLDLVSHLDRARFDPLVFLPARSPLVPHLDTCGIHWCDLPLPRLNVRSPFTPFHWLSAARRLAHLARQQRVDLIHANTVRAHLVSAFIRHIPVVWMLHDDTFPRWLFKALSRRPAQLIANSRATARHYQIDRHPKVSVVHNGVDTHRPPGDGLRFRRHIGVGPEKILIAHVGRLARWKGQHIFIRAAARIAPAFPNAHFTLVGTFTKGDEALGVLGGGATYHDALRKLAAALGLNDRLTFAGHQDNIADVYAGIDVLVHSSTRPEPFGRVLIEAMAAAVPPIASDQGGPTEIVEDGVTGLLIAPGSSELLAEAMSLLIRDSARRAEMGRAAQQRARERFDIRLQVERIQSIYADVLRHRI